MRYAFVAIVATLSATVLSQSLSELPPCAQSCVGNSLSSLGCGNLNIACICGSANWISQLSCCISQTCSPQDQNTTITFADQLCETNGVTLPSVASCASSSTPTSSSTSSSTESSTSSGASGASGNSNATVSVTMSRTPTATLQTTSKSGSSSASTTSNAAARDGYAFGLGLVAAGLYAMVL